MYSPCRLCKLTLNCRAQPLGQVQWGDDSARGIDARLLANTELVWERLSVCCEGGGRLCLSAVANRWSTDYY